MKGIHALVISCLLVLSGCANQAKVPYAESRSIEDSLAARTRLGMQYLQASDATGAKQAFQQALDLDSDYAPALNGLALSFQVEQEAELAEQYFREAIAADRDAAIYHNNLGAFLYAQQRYPEACKSLARATEDPFYNRRAQAFENLGYCYQLIERLPAAAHAFQRALHLDAKRTNALLGLAQVQFELKQYREAGQSYDTFLERVQARKVEHSARSLWLGVRLARIQQRPGRAATYAILLKNLYPDSVEYRLYKETEE